MCLGELKIFPQMSDQGLWLPSRISRIALARTSVNPDKHRVIRKIFGLMSTFTQWTRCSFVPSSAQFSPSHFSSSQPNEACSCFHLPVPVASRLADSPTQQFELRRKQLKYSVNANCSSGSSPASPMCLHSGASLSLVSPSSKHSVRST